MKKIVVVNQDSGYLMIDICNAFIKEGFEVSLISGRLVQRDRPLDPKVKYNKIIKYRRTTIIGKLFTWILGLFQIIYKVRFKYRTSYLLIISNPPLAPLIPLFLNNSFSLLVYDIYIETPESFSFFNQNSFLVRKWKETHSKVLSQADNIFTLTNGMSQIIEKYSNGKKCTVVPIWTDNEFLKPVSSENNPFIIENNLQNKFVVLYSGSIGISSGLEYLVDVASIIHIDQIMFVIVGDGIKKQTIATKIEELDLKNCIMLSWQDPNILPYSLASANLAVVSLAHKSSQHAIPSKLFNYMSVGAPVLCLADLNSDLGKLIQQENIGMCFYPEQKNEIAEFVMNLFNSTEQTLYFSERSLTTSKKFTRENVNIIINAIKYLG